MLERGAGRIDRQRVAGERAADAAGVDQVDVVERVDPVGECGVEPVGADRDAAGDRLADRDDVGLEVPRACGAARTRRERVGLVVDQQRAVASA